MIMLVAVSAGAGLGGLDERVDSFEQAVVESARVPSHRGAHSAIDGHGHPRDGVCYLSIV